MTERPPRRPLLDPEHPDLVDQLRRLRAGFSRAQEADYRELCTTWHARSGTLTTPAQRVHLAECVRDGTDPNPHRMRDYERPAR